MPDQLAAENLLDNATTAELLTFPFEEWDGKEWDIRKFNRAARFSDKVVGGLQICHALDEISKVATRSNSRTFALNDFRVVFDKNGNLRRSRTSEGEALLDWNGKVVKNSDRKPLNGGDHKLNNSPYDTFSIIDADEFGVWFTKTFPICDLHKNKWNMFNSRITATPEFTQEVAKVADKSASKDTSEVKKLNDEIYKLKEEIVLGCLTNFRRNINSMVDNSVKEAQAERNDEALLEHWLQIADVLEKYTADVYDYMQRLRDNKYNHNKAAKVIERTFKPVTAHSKTGKSSAESSDSAAKRQKTS